MSECACAYVREEVCACVGNGERESEQKKRPTSHCSLPPPSLHPSLPAGFVPLISPVLAGRAAALKRGSDWLLKGGMDGWRNEVEDRLPSWTLMKTSWSGPSPADSGPDVPRAVSRTGAWIGFASRDTLPRNLCRNRRATLLRCHAPPLFGRRDRRGVTRLSDAAPAGPVGCLRITPARTWLKHAGESPAQVAAPPPAYPRLQQVRGVYACADW